MHGNEPETRCRPGNPMSSMSRSVVSLFSRSIRNDLDMIRLLDSDADPRATIEREYRGFMTDNDPVYLTPFTSREMLVKAFINSNKGKKWIDWDAGGMVALKSWLVDSVVPETASENDAMFHEFPGNLDDIKLYIGIKKHVPSDDHGDNPTIPMLHGGYMVCNNPVTITGMYGITSTEAKKIPKCLQKFKHLENLTITLYPPGHHGIIENVGGMHSLKNISITLSGIERIENLDDLPALEVLDLAWNHIKKLGKVDHLHNLRILDLVGNPIPPKECNEFKKSMASKINVMCPW